jgi:hypothetical protein
MLFWQTDKNMAFFSFSLPPEVPKSRKSICHLKKGMMVDILPHIVQVVVLAPGSNTLLRVHYPKKNGEG